jgi:biotin transporter BioY
MAKYVKGDADYKGFSDFDKASFENYMLGYNVDANIETAKGGDAISNIKEIMMGGKAKMDFTNPKTVYLMVYMILIGLAVILILGLVIFIIIMLFSWLVKKNDISKLKLQVAASLIIFIIGMAILIFTVNKLSDNVQKTQEKIVYKL